MPKPSVTAINEKKPLLDIREPPKETKISLVAWDIRGFI